jgi:hypothetical protein
MSTMSRIARRRLGLKASTRDQREKTEEKPTTVTIFDEIKVDADYIQTYKDFQKTNTFEISEFEDIEGKEVDQNKTLYEKYVYDWNMFARDILGVCLDKDQQEILYSVQMNTRTSVRSGHARGKDFTAAVAAVCYLYLLYPSKVICTAPTERQVVSIMMSEIASIIGRANTRLKEHGACLGGELYTQKILFPGEPDHFLEGFKAADKATESWTGYHSPNPLIVITEASGIAKETFDAIEGLLTGERPRLLLVGNPNNTNGGFYDSFKDKTVKGFVLNCMNAPNVISKKNLIPGQCNWDWVNDHVHKKGWTLKIQKEQYSPKQYKDFTWEGEYYRPTDLFKSRVMGEFPEQSEDSLIPFEWIEEANNRWVNAYSAYNDHISQVKNCEYNKDLPPKITIEGTALKYILSIDVAGQGADTTVIGHKYGQFVGHFEVSGRSRSHMDLVGRIISRAKIISHFAPGVVNIDAIGEGSGAFSRIEEIKEEELNAYFERYNLHPITINPVKFSEGSKGYRDTTDQLTFANMRAYCYWAIRDALNPALDGALCLPPDEELKEELIEHKYKKRSNGSILIEEKDKVKSRIGRSPDKADALAQMFWPKVAAVKEQHNIMEGLGIF